MLVCNKFCGFSYFIFVILQLISNACVLLQPSFAPVPAQPALKPFVPATPPTLKNVEQYQQPAYGSQLYPVCMVSNFAGGFFVHFL